MSKIVSSFLKTCGYGLVAILAIGAIASAFKPKAKPAAKLDLEPNFAEIEQMIRQEAVNIEIEHKKLNQQLKKEYAARGLYWSPYND